MPVDDVLAICMMSATAPNRAWREDHASSNLTARVFRGDRSYVVRSVTVEETKLFQSVLSSENCSMASSVECIMAIRSMLIAAVSALQLWHRGSLRLHNTSGNHTQNQVSFPETVREIALLSNIETKMQMRISLWLMPPADAAAPLRAQIAELSKTYSGSAPFEPHMTIIGGIEVDSNTQAQEIGRRLEEGLRGVGAVPCKFDDQVVSMVDEECNYVWNQASLARMESCNEFDRLVHVSGELLGVDTSTRKFLLPVGQPHFSFFYGKRNAPPSEEVQAPPDFVARDAALWYTYPGDADGVKSWTQICRFSLE